MASLPVRIFNGTVISFVGRFVGTLISIATISIITRSLITVSGKQEGVAAFGVYSAVLVYISVISILADGGLYLYFTRTASREGADEKRVLEEVWQLRLYSILGAMLVGVIFVFLVPYPGSVRVGVTIGIWAMAFQILSQLFMGVFQKHLRLWPPAMAEVAGRVIQLAAVLVLIQFVANVNAFLIALILGTATTFLINILFARYIVSFRIFSPIKWETAKKITYDAFPLSLMLIFSVVFFKVDSLLLSFLRPAADLAYYALPYKILESLLFFPAVLGGMLLPVFSRAGTGTIKGIEKTLRGSFVAYAAGAVPLCLILYFSAPLIIYILGGTAFAPSIPVLRVLSLALGVLFFGNLFGTTLVAINQQKALVHIYAWLVLINIGLNLLVIPRYSFMGAAWTTLITETLSVILAYRVLHKNGVRLFGVKEN